MRDIVDAVDQINALLSEKSFDDLASDRFLKAAFERFLEILSEASRHIPPGLKSSAPEVPWRRIADIGNHLRHAYHHVDVKIIWALHAEGELGRLREVAGNFIAEIDQTS